MNRSTFFMKVMLIQILGSNHAFESELPNDAY